MSKLWCVLFDSKRSKAVSKVQAHGLKGKMSHHVALQQLHIVPFDAVRKLPIYDAIEIHAGFTVYQEGE
jgi:hypothetical protein